MRERRPAADGVAGGLLHRLRIGAADLAAGDRPELPFVDPVRTRGDHEARALVHGEDVRLVDLADGDAQGVRRLLGSPRFDGKLDHLTRQTERTDGGPYLLHGGLHSDRASSHSFASAARLIRAGRRGPRQRYRSSRMWPRRTRTPSCSSITRCVNMPLTLARTLIPPLAFTTRCQGTPGGQCRIAYPTARADLGQPRIAAICP